MSVNIIYFVHGTTFDNEKGLASGWKNSRLSPLGIKQAKELKKIVGAKKFAAVFCSDLIRASVTAKIAFGSKLNPIKDQRLRECNYGRYNGYSSDIVEKIQLRSIIKKFPGGESYNDVKKRMKDFLDYLTDNFDNQTVAVVSHKAPQLALEVLTKKINFKQALALDWRKIGSWQPGWKYRWK